MLFISSVPETISRSAARVTQAPLTSPSNFSVKKLGDRAGGTVARLEPH